MCLSLNATKTNKLKEKYKKNGNKKIVVWKVFSNRYGYVETPFRGKVVGAGWLKANSVDESDGGYSGMMITLGIHVHSTRELARIMARRCSTRRVTKCWAYARDFVCYGESGDMTFRKIWIPKEEITRITRKKK